MVFISYTHDSPEHSSEVLGLANLLRKKGVETVIDQYETFPAVGWPVWMEKNLNDAKFVLIVCSKRYYEKSAAQNDMFPSGGRWESFLVYQDLYEAAAKNEKFIPVLLEGGEPSCIPKPLRAFSRYRLPDQFEDLYRYLTAQPKVIPPSLGVRDEMPSNSDEISQTDSTTGAAVGTLTQTSEVELHLDFDFDKFSESVEERFLKVVRLLLEDHDVTIRRKRRGSVILDLTLTPQQAERLKWAVSRGELDSVLGCSVQLFESSTAGHGSASIDDRLGVIDSLWFKSRKLFTEEEYNDFYSVICDNVSVPSYRLHVNCDAPLEFNALIFAPNENTEQWGMRKIEPAVALYCKKVLIDSSPKGLLPEWMRFLKGVVDSADLPLGISRQTMQDSALVRKLGSMIAKRVVKMFETEAESDPEKFLAFYKKFDRFFKEGVATDYANKEGIAKLLRFESSRTDKGALSSFADYVARAKDGQDKIYYLVGPSRMQLESGPYIEAFKARGLEVVYFTDPVDEYVVESLGEFEGYQFVSISHAGVELEDSTTEGDALSAEATGRLCSFLKNELGDKVISVASGKRLVDSPVIALVPQDGMTLQMRRMMKAMDENFQDEVRVELEINPRHPLVKKLAEASETNPELAKLVACQLFDNALIAAGLLDDARDLVRRMNVVLERLWLGNSGS